MTAEERIATLEAQLSQVLEQLRLTQEELRQAHEQLAVAYKRIEELEKQKTPPPAFGKANVKKRQDDQKKPRKKRDPKHNRARRREEPMQIIEHLITACPVCSSRLGGVSVARRRQVIELPPPPPIEVSEHVVYHGWCSQCGTWREAPLDVSTPRVRYYEYHHSRGSEVVKQLLGESFEGVLGSDFYACTGYLDHPFKNRHCETEKDLHPLLANTGESVYNQISSTASSCSKDDTLT